VSEDRASEIARDRRPAVARDRSPDKARNAGPIGDVRLEQVWKLFGDETPAVANLNLTIKQGEFLVLVGPSGCGKTTSLRMLAGLERPTFGRILFGERDVTTLGAGERDVAMVFQSYALYPHMSVYKNLAFGPTVRHDSRQALRSRIDEVAKSLGIDDLLKRRPNELSGGQRQRVALGRALIREPQLFLLDEPLSNLDAALRVQMRAELIRLHKRLGMTTTVYVTHDQVEALTLGDRVAVLKDGELMQVDTPPRLYDNPSNTFVAGFIGSPKMNLFAGVIRTNEDRVAVRSLGVDIELGPSESQHLPVTEDQPVILGLRPADLRPIPDLAKTDETSRLQAVVDVVEHTGSEIFVTVAIEKQLLTARFSRWLFPEIGDRVELGFNPTELYVFRPDTGERLLDRAAIRSNPRRAPERGLDTVGENRS
jgi:multiple sugar transport system ATP-binding protein